MRVSTIGSQTLTLIMMDTTPPIKVTVLSMLSQTMERSGTIPTTMDTAITPLRPTSLMLVQSYLEHQARIALAALTETVMAGPMSAIGHLRTSSSGPIVTVTDTETITTLTSMNTNSISINPETHSRMKPRNGTIQTAMDTETITITFHGKRNAQVSGQDSCFKVPTNRTHSHLNGPNTLTAMAIGSETIQTATGQTAAPTLGATQFTTALAV